MKSKKLLSLLLALMMMLSVVPMYASAAEALKAANVTQWPTVSYKNADGKMYFGQTVSEALIINDDEIVVDANGGQVAGHFEFYNPAQMPNAGQNLKLNIKFVPDDTETYAGFNKLFSSLTYNVETVTPVYIDEINDPLVASEVESNSLLSTSMLSGGKMTNPYNNEEPLIVARAWEWVNPSTVVNESGYYEAMFVPSGSYVKITAQVYVRIAGEIPETAIAEVPTVDTQTYDGVTTWGDVELKGGKAVLKIEGTEVAGTFAVTDYWKTRTVNVGSYEIDVTFTPADPEAALPYSLKIPVTVNKAPIKFVDENGAEIVPEVTVDYGTKMNYVATKLKDFTLNTTENCWFRFADGVEETDLAKTGTYNVVVRSYETNSNYLETTLPVKVTVAPKTLNVKINSAADEYYVVDDSGVYGVQGTFDFYVDGELVASDIKYLEGKVKWEATENGTYELKFVYNPVENDNFIIDDVVITKTVIFPNTITYNSDMPAYILTGSSRSELFETTERTPGDSVTIGCDLPAFAAWVITDANGNAVDLGVDLTAAEITFTMPDYDIIIEAKTAETGDDNTGDDDDSGITLPDLDLDTDGSHKFSFVNIIKNIVEMIKDFIQQIGDFFSNMSLDSLGEVIG